jgi:hypothetical protein
LTQKLAVRVDNVPMAHFAKSSTLAHRVLERFDLGIVKLKKSAAIQTNDVIVMFFAGKLENFLAPFIHQRFMKHSRFNQKRDRSVNGSSADAWKLSSNSSDHFAGIEMVRPRKQRLDHAVTRDTLLETLLGQSLPNPDAKRMIGSDRRVRLLLFRLLPPARQKRHLSCLTATGGSRFLRHFGIASAAG